MLGNRSRPRIPLPKQWPSRVRSGVLHAISLAHFSLTFTRSGAASDHGNQLTDEGFRRWCTRRGMRQRVGAVGKYGSIAVVERFIRTLRPSAHGRSIPAQNSFETARAGRCGETLLRFLRPLPSVFDLDFAPHRQCTITSSADSASIPLISSPFTIAGRLQSELGTALRDDFHAGALVGNRPFFAGVV